MTDEGSRPNVSQRAHFQRLLNKKIRKKNITILALCIDPHLDIFSNKIKKYYINIFLGFIGNPH